MSLVAYEKLNVDSPLAMLNDELLRLATSPGWARGLLVLATLVAAPFSCSSSVRRCCRDEHSRSAAWPRWPLSSLPAETVYAFERLFKVNGTNGLPVTLDQSGVFGWIDRAVGPTGRVTAARFPVNSPDYWAGVGYWWDVEFWNESVVDWSSASMSSRGRSPGSAASTRRTGI